MLELRQNFWYLFSHCPQAGPVEQDCNPILPLLTGWSCGLYAAPPSLQLRLPPHPQTRNLTGLFLPPVCSAHTYSLAVCKAAFHLRPGSGPGPVCCPITSLSSVYSPEGFLPRGLYMFPVLHIFVTILLMTFLFHLRVPRPKG